MINDRLSDLQPSASAELARANAVAWQSTDPALLELCRHLVINMLGLDAESSSASGRASRVDPRKLAEIGAWENSDQYSSLERAALGFTEQFVLSVSSVSVGQVEALREHMDDEAVYAFAAALYLVEMTERLNAVAVTVIGQESRV